MIKEKELIKLNFFELSRLESELKEDYKQYYKKYIKYKKDSYIKELDLLYNSLILVRKYIKKFNGYKKITIDEKYNLYSYSCIYTLKNKKEAKNWAIKNIKYLSNVDFEIKNSKIIIYKNYDL